MIFRVVDTVKYVHSFEIGEKSTRQNEMFLRDVYPGIILKYLCYFGHNKYYGYFFVTNVRVCKYLYYRGRYYISKK